MKNQNFKENFYFKKELKPRNRVDAIIYRHSLMVPGFNSYEQDYLEQVRGTSNWKTRRSA